MCHKPECHANTKYAFWTLSSLLDSIRFLYSPPSTRNKIMMDVQRAETVFQNILSTYQDAAYESIPGYKVKPITLLDCAFDKVIDKEEYLRWVLSSIYSEKCDVATESPSLIDSYHSRSISDKLSHLALRSFQSQRYIPRNWAWDKYSERGEVLLTIAIVWPLRYSISFTVRADLGVAHLVPKGESPELRVIVVPFKAEFSCTTVIFEVSAPPFSDGNLDKTRWKARNSTHLDFISRRQMRLTNRGQYWSSCMSISTVPGKAWKARRGTHCPACRRQMVFCCASRSPFQFYAKAPKTWLLLRKNVREVNSWTQQSRWTAIPVSQSAPQRPAHNGQVV